MELQNLPLHKNFRSSRFQHKMLLNTFWSIIVVFLDGIDDFVDQGEIFEWGF